MPHQRIGTAFYEKAKTLLDYDPETGDLIWKEYQHWKAKKGSIAGTRGSKGRQVRVGGRKLLSHRVAWFITHGTLPSSVRHVNMDVFDNSLVNLYASSSSEVAVITEDSAPVKGIVYASHYKMWRAVLHTPEGAIDLGLYDTKAEAVKVRRDAELNSQLF